MYSSLVLSWAGEPDNSRAGSKLRVFRWFLLFHIAMGTALKFQMGAFPGPWAKALAVLLLVVTSAGCIPRLSRFAARIAVFLLLAFAVFSFPSGSNHSFIEMICMGFFALLDPEDRTERVLLGQGLRWFVAIAFFYTGVQKLLYGTWFDGQLLGYLISSQENFATFFAPFIDAGELARLKSLDTMRVVWHPGNILSIDAGPYRVASIWVVAMGNASWLGELLCGIGLILRRTRPWAAIAAITLVVAIQVGARELVFGVLMIQCLLLFFERDWNRRLLLPTVAFYLYLAAVRGGVLPKFTFYL